MHPWLYMLGLIGLMLGFAVVWCIAFPMFAIGGLRPSELRERLIAAALRTYTHQGESIPGLKRGPVAGLVLWLMRYDGADAPKVGDRREGKRVKYAAEHVESESVRHTKTDKYVPGGS
jgi:hypothetical protein